MDLFLTLFIISQTLGAAVFSPEETQKLKQIFFANIHSNGAMSPCCMPWN